MTSKSRALLRALAVVAVAAIALAGCGGNSGSSTNEGSSGDKTRLTWFMWTGSDAEVKSWKHVADMVTQKNPDITITFQTASFTDYFTKLAAQASGGNAPCLLGMQSLRAPGLGQLLRPLDDLAKKEGVDLSQFD
jgi:multiple sugar transport system substrate-binding protein